jgi:hypothetical protein
MHIPHYRWRVVASLAAAGLALAAVTPLSGAPMQFGTRSLDIPSPTGFVPVSEDIPAYIALAQAYLPPGNRLAEIYLAPDTKDALIAGDQPDIPRFFQVQVMRTLEGKPVSEVEFAGAMDQMEAEFAKLVPDMDAEAAKLTERGNENLRTETGEDAKLAISGIRYHGAFRREPWGLFFSMSSEVQASGGYGTESGRMISAGALALINHQLLYLYAYAEDDGAEAQQWAQGQVSAWADAARAANLNDPAVAAQAEPLGGFDFGSIGRKALIGGLIGLLIGVIFWFRARGK